MELAEYLQNKDAQQLAAQTLDTSSLKRLGTDARFEALMEALRNAASGPEGTEVIANAARRTGVRITRSGRGLKFWSTDDLATDSAHIWSARCPT